MINDKPATSDSENKHLNNQEVKSISLIESWDSAIEAINNILKTPLSQVQIDKLKLFYQLLVETNKVMNLTKLDSLPDFLTFHLLDTALVAALYSSQCQNKKLRYIDLGSGCGVPGIILHILLMNEFQTQTVLCDSRAKRTAYLKKTVTELKLETQITVETHRAEVLAANKMFKNYFDLVTARAFAKPIETLKAAIPFLKIDGVFAAQLSIDCSLDEEYKKEAAKHKMQIAENQGWELNLKPRFVSLIKRKAK